MPRTSRSYCALEALGAVLALAYAGTACTGVIESAPDGPTGRGSGASAGARDDARPGDGQVDANACAEQQPAVGSGVLRRLSNLELQGTLQDLFQLRTPPSIDGIPADADKDGFKTFAEVQPVSAQHVRAYAENARELADALLADDARRRAVVGCEPGASGCLRAFVTRFGRLAYRRSLAAAETEAIVASAEQNALDAPDQLRFAIQALLSSASFLYRIELGEAGDGSVSRLQPDELASRLSFALWGRTPSSELLDQAAAGRLESRDATRALVRSMIADGRTQQFYASFFRQWLGYEAVRAPAARPPDWSDALLQDMQGETDALLREYAFERDGLLAALTTDHTFATPALARFYGLPAPGADGRVMIPPAHPRAGAGLLTHASLLSAKSDGDLIAIRGNWLRRTFLCSSLQIPGDVAEELGDLLVGLTRVEIVQKRNSERACKGCHAQIDPIGIGLAKFDAAGRWDETLDTDAFGVAAALPDAPEPAFETARELAQKLAAMPEVAACVTEKVFLYMHGRAADDGDRCTVEGATRAFVAGGHDFRALLSSLIESPSFGLRRAPDDAGEE